MKTYFVDSFTTEIFKGNPAAVCLPDSELDNDTMQKIATEIGFSETAFIKQLTANTYSIRFFTPKIEIPLCGHATLASSKIIFDTTSVDKIKFINCDSVEFLMGNQEVKLKCNSPFMTPKKLKYPEKCWKHSGSKKS